MLNFKFLRGYISDIIFNLLPLVMAVAERTIGMDLVSVQPMAGPSSQLFYIDYQYGEEPYIKRFSLKDFKFLRGC
jgi:hypothetical protein